MKASFSLVPSVLLSMSVPFVAKGATTPSDVLLAGTLDLEADTITLPLYEGSLVDGRKVWYILTDVSTRGEADRLGIVYAPKLAAAANVSGTREAEWSFGGPLVFASGTVDFAPQRALTPGDAPHPFPPRSFQPGSVADAGYSPFAVVRTGDQAVVYNAPVIAFDVDATALTTAGGQVNYDRVHDKVVRINPEHHLVTLHLSHGFADGHSLVYLSFDANNPMAATMEASTYAPAINALTGATVDLNIYAVANGETGSANPNRQGFDSALSGEGSPLNVLDHVPSSAFGYSPLWNLYLGAWTDPAVVNGNRTRLDSEAAFYDAVAAGLLTGPGGGAFGSTGILINCPVVAILD